MNVNSAYLRAVLESYTFRSASFIKCECCLSYLELTVREKGRGVLSRFSALVSQRDQLVTSGLRSQTEIVLDDVIEEWKALWRDRCNDKVKAEAMANRDFSLLRIERGTVIAAPRAFKPLDLRNILKNHRACDVSHVVPLHPSTGGWRKFARTVLIRQSRARVGKRSSQKRSRERYLQRKKCGRGWLHRR